MINTSTLYKTLAAESGRLFFAQIICTLSDTTELTLTDDDIMQDSLQIQSAVSGEEALEVGCAIIPELDFEIDNSSGQYDNMSFEDAELRLRIGLLVGQSYTGELTIEWIDKGLFTVEEVIVNENTLSVIAYGIMAKFDTPFSDVSSRPSTLGQLYAAVCTHCGIPYDTLNFTNANMSISYDNVPDDASCRDIISYVAQLACSFAYVDSSGTLQLGWFTETDYVVNDRQRINGSVTVTGVRLADAEDTEHVYMIGSADYSLFIDNNPFPKSIDPLLRNVWYERLIGTQSGDPLTVTPFEAEVLSDPSLEAGDIVTVSDLAGNTYRTPITSIDYRLDGKMRIVSAAQTVKENRRSRNSLSAKILSVARTQTKQQLSEYDIRAKRFSELTANAMGFYQTEETQNDGSTITYQHDKPLLVDSQIIWKKSASSFAVSTDGGMTWRGLDAAGNAVLNVLAADGINANWITAGILQGIQVIAQIGSIAGWEMDNGVLVSSDGSMKIDSVNNIIRTFDSNGDEVLKISSNGIDISSGGNHIGQIGIATSSSDGLGLSFALDDNGGFMTWMYKNAFDAYSPVLNYSRTNGLELGNDVLGTALPVRIYGRKVVPVIYTDPNGNTLNLWGWHSGN
ncbi:MAG: hypothetical protein VZR73_10065 [Acutalibacteraceae bacterium]|nr:hypothetical protein [Acutalibacteraceae bacterium]